MIDLSLEKIWQEEENSIWYTNIKPVCNVCGKEVKTAIEIKTNMTSLPIRLCLDPNRGCMQYSINFYFTKSKTLQYLWVRLLQYKSSHRIKSNRKPIFREPIRLSKRYGVLRRDGFQCVLCGASGKDSKLEIDHIIPVSAGGSNDINNLRTLCFKCNRGKQNQIEGV